MRGSPYRRLCPRRLVAMGLGLIAALALVAGVAAARPGVPGATPGAILVAHPSVDPLLESVGEGLGAWLRLRLVTAGLSAAPREVNRSIAPASRADAVSPDAWLALGERLGAAGVVFPDLRLTSGQVEVRLRLYDPTERRLRGVARATRPLGSIGEACESAAVDLVAFLGLAVRPGPAPQLDALAASGRALLLGDRGELLAAWREVERKLSPTPAAVRKAVLEKARRSDGSAAERARVLAAAGEASTAWSLIDQAVRHTQRSGRPDAQLLLAAAEVELARHNPREARRYIDDLEKTSARSSEIERLTARVLIEQNDSRGAREALRRAVQLDPEDVAALEQLAALEPAGDPHRARLLLQAGQGEVARLNPHRATTLLDRAASESSELRAESLRSIGAMEQTLGRPAKALTAWREAVEADDSDVSAFTGMGDSLQALGESDEAEQAYRKALALAPSDADALGGLGAVELSRGAAAKAVPLLQRATRVDPEHALRRRNLAQALRATGDLDQALEVLEASDAPASLANLRLAAEIHTQLGQHERARDSLLQATRLDPFDAEVQEQLAAAYEATGDSESAGKAREFTALLRGTAPDVDGNPNLAVAGRTAGGPDGASLATLARSFASAISHPGDRAVVRLEVRDATTPRSRLAAWLHPRAPDFDAIAASLDAALADSFVLLEAPTFENPALIDRIDALYAFEDRTSLDAHTVAIVNEALGTDALFVARVDRMPETDPEAHPGGSCADAARAVLEVRMLAGDHPDVVAIHANHECLAGAMAGAGVWNRRAFAVYAAVVLFLMFPLLRGWGRVEVRIKIPPKTKGFLAIRLSMKEDDLPTVRKKKADTGRLKMSLRSLSRYEKQMAGRVTLFRWIPARKRSYYVTVKGPLTDAAGLENIGHFLETQRLRVRRGRTNTVEFDFQPKESGVDVRVQLGDQPVHDARIALRGVPGSVRFARGGHAILPLGAGRHQLLVGTSDRVGEFAVEIQTLGRSVQIVADLADERVLVFQGCPAAVDPYLNGDYGAAAGALAASGLEQQAHLARALHHELMGETDRAATELEAAGRFEDAAELRVASGDDLAGSAELFERAGDHGRAADAYRAAGDVRAAARCYEAAYDYDNALECWQEAGDDAKAVEILEKTGEFFEAGRLAHRLGEVDRALANLQQVEKRDPNYGEACTLIAAVLELRGDFDVAADKVKEALTVAGGAAPAALHERHAELLSRAGRQTEAIDAYQTVRRIEPQRRDVSDRIAELERLSGGAKAGGDSESRYEILGELGRGAMGVVYKARDKHLGRTVALKRLPDNLRDHPAAVSLFRREAQAAAALNHRNIVTLFDAGEENGSYFITMELLEGLPLNQILKKKGRLGVGDTARLGIQIAAGLQYAHDQRIVHRDIKAGNLFFTRDREVKIMDFGLAKTIEEVRKTSTMIGGTPYYMAPEQAAGEELDHRADLYAMGVTLYQLVAGTVPFREGDLAYHHRHTAPPDPRTYAPEIPAELAELILAMLAKLPGDRPASAAEVGRRLQAVLDAHQQQKR